VIDGKPGAKYHAIRMDAGCVFPPKGDRYAYAALWRGKWGMVIDGQLVGRYSSVSAPTWSDDGRRIAFIGTDVGGDELVVDGPVKARVGRIDPYSVAFSPDGRRLAYSEDRPHPAVVVDGKRWPLRGMVLYSHLRFSPDSRHLAYVEGSKRAYYGGSWRVVVDGKPGKAYVTVSALGFTSDGEVHYGARRTWQDALVVVGDRESPIYDSIQPTPYIEPLGGYWGDPAPVFSADGKHNAYGVATGGKGWVVLDGQKGPVFQRVAEVVFSPDGRSLAYGAMVRENEWVVMLNGRPGPCFRAICGTPVFSPDGKRLACVAYSGPPKGQSEIVAVVDGRPGPSLQSAPMIAFSADSRHVAYVARAGKEEWVVLDGQNGPQYDEVLRPRPSDVETHLAFRSDGSVQYLGQRGDTIYRVRQFPPKSSG
jgi:roadblock/LC7 domain-containing protein